MEKAYELSALVAKLKGRGLDVVEAAGVVVVEEVIAWVEESAELSATPFDNIALIVLPEIKKIALSAVDKIDGQVG